ncbi:MULTISPECIES: ogr/Delta-like zinc finger family protein [Stenotrophomonas]|uniref:ogr/Delta-like zinc finger family protein n=1 Tax=Stenotrophomonas TaxID=40323 RepID=UPI0009B2AB53|nr:MULTISPECIES: ogr/Delta-like zinc finger family protein [Stenotrophomonas]
MSAVVGQRAIFTCDVCGTPLTKRTSALQHRHLRTDAYVCQNPVCGATYVGHSELTSISSPSGMPNAPACELPQTPGYERALLLQRWKEDRGNVQLDWIDAPSTRSPDGGDLPAV